MIAKKCLAGMALMLMFQGTPALAQEAEAKVKELTPESRVLIDKILDLSDINSTIDRMWKAAVHRMGNDLYKLALRDAAKNKSLSKEKQRAQADDVVNRVLDNLSKRFKDEYKNEYVKIYRDIYNQFYTKEDLEIIYEFYNSETGKKTKRVLPGMIKEGIGDLKEQIDLKVKKCLMKRLQTNTESDTTKKEI